MKAGVAKWDVNYVAFDNYEDYVPYHKKYLLGMTQHGLLKMVPDLIDTVNRHIVALHGRFQAVAFNKQLIASDRIPATWDGFLNPEFRERKIATHVRAVMFAALVPAWGLEKNNGLCQEIGGSETDRVEGRESHYQLR